ncbi:hypothetical protein [Streptomyces griseomycini]|uniref:Uncharacterized protein n=1 Tax=Streptomyces griseomycini TaxID=66895 RepID=A0A7W7PWB2_9ACTN|nr:hypothetical protein [Streptomyces griseomycini]MBB4902541.1 hypothetical protein [Streptomyces griseomycini]GGR52300.1 hypothetical protein GCM10015536_67330 [Streptomyces griseomycini]
MASASVVVPQMPGATNVEEAWAKLPDYLAAIGGYDMWYVEALVRFDGAQRAGARIMERITERLAEHNIGHLPDRLPTDGNCRVLLYNRDQFNVGFLLRLVHELATQEYSDNTNALVGTLKITLDGHRKVLQAAERKVKEGQ